MAIKDLQSAHEHDREARLHDILHDILAAETADGCISAFFKQRRRTVPLSSGNVRPPHRAAAIQRLNGGTTCVLLRTQRPIRRPTIEKVRESSESDVNERYVFRRIWSCRNTIRHTTRTSSGGTACTSGLWARRPTVLDEWLASNMHVSALPMRRRHNKCGYSGHRVDSSVGVHVGHLGEPMQRPLLICATMRGPLSALLS
jgi:hypothetical protein